MRAGAPNDWRHSLVAHDDARSRLIEFEVFSACLIPHLISVQARKERKSVFINHRMTPHLFKTNSWGSVRYPTDAFATPILNWPINPCRSAGVRPLHMPLGFQKNDFRRQLPLCLSQFKNKMLPAAFPVIGSVRSGTTSTI